MPGKLKADGVFEGGGVQTDRKPPAQVTLLRQLWTDVSASYVEHAPERGFSTAPHFPISSRKRIKAIGIPVTRQAIPDARR
jgi:hypothetical protein